MASNKDFHVRNLMVKGVMSGLNYWSYDLYFIYLFLLGYHIYWFSVHTPGSKLKAYSGEFEGIKLRFSIC